MVDDMSFVSGNGNAKREHVEALSTRTFQNIFPAHASSILECITRQI
jgi:hypothetical protein